MLLIAKEKFQVLKIQKINTTFFVKEVSLKNNESYKIASCFAELTVVSVMELLNYLQNNKLWFLFSITELKWIYLSIDTLEELICLISGL